MTDKARAVSGLMDRALWQAICYTGIPRGVPGRNGGVQKTSRIVVSMTVGMAGKLYPDDAACREYAASGVVKVIS